MTSSTAGPFPPNPDAKIPTPEEYAASINVALMGCFAEVEGYEDDIHRARTSIAATRERIAELQRMRPRARRVKKSKPEKKTA